MKSRKTFAANLTGMSSGLHLVFLPEVPKVSPHKMQSSTTNKSTTVIDEASKSSSSSMKNTSTGHESPRYDIDIIPLFTRILSGHEPDITPGTASAWIRVQHGGSPMSALVRLANDDSISLYPDCFKGSCVCKHHIGRCISQLKPCYFAVQFVGHLDLMSEADAYVLYGVFYGFPIIDSTLVEPYFCENYSRITSGDGYSKMSERIETELIQQKISVSTEPVKCVHALGAIFKSNGFILPITDCKRPIGLSINNTMNHTCYTFRYSNIETVCEFLRPGDYLCVVDISNAYRSVNVFPSHVYF